MAIQSLPLCVIIRPCSRLCCVMTVSMVAHGSSAPIQSRCASIPRWARLCTGCARVTFERHSMVTPACCNVAGACRRWLGAAHSPVEGIPRLWCQCAASARLRAFEAVDDLLCSDRSCDHLRWSLVSLRFLWTFHLNPQAVLGLPVLCVQDDIFARVTCRAQLVGRTPSNCRCFEGLLRCYGCGNCCSTSIVRRTL